MERKPGTGGKREKAPADGKRAGAAPVARPAPTMLPGRLGNQATLRLLGAAQPRSGAGAARAGESPSAAKVAAPTAPRALGRDASLRAASGAIGNQRLLGMLRATTTPALDAAAPVGAAQPPASSLARAGATPPEPPSGRSTRPRAAVQLSSAARPPAPIAPAAVLGELGAGEPIARPLASRFSAALGGDLSGVRVHPESHVPSGLGARALAVGDHVAFAPGRFQPQTSEGQGLIAHELTHVLQQRRGDTPSDGQGRPGDAHEHAADRAAARLASEPAGAGAASTSGAPRLAVQLQPDDTQDKLPATPLEVQWGGDRFSIAFHASTEDSTHYLDLDLQYIGAYSAEFEYRRRLRAQLGPAKFDVKTTVLPTGGVRIDPFGTGVRVIDLVDRYDFDTFKKARRHKLDLLDSFTRDGLTLWVNNPASKEGDHSEEAKPFASADRPVFLGGISAVDVTLGPYLDHFRLTLQTTGRLEDDKPNKIIFGISALWQGKPLDGMGKEFTFPRTPVIQVLSADAGTVTLDLDGDGVADLTIGDRITTPADYDGGGPTEVNRNHYITVNGPQFGDKEFYFTVRWSNNVKGGYAQPQGVDKAAVSNAQAISGLAEREKEGMSFAENLDAFETAMLSIRKDALDANIISKPLYDAWYALAQSMTKLKAKVKTAGGTDEPSLRIAAADQASAFYDALATATAGREEIEPNYSESSTLSTTNKYTGETVTHVYLLAWETSTLRSSGQGAEIGFDLLMHKDEAAFSAYQVLTKGLDTFIADRLVEVKGKDDPQAQKVQAIIARRGALGEIEKYKPIIIPAVFHPDSKFNTEEGYIPEVPLALFAWREGTRWTLRDLTNPAKTYDFHADGKEGDDTPPLALFDEMNDPDHFPEGRIHYQIPGSYGGQVRTQDYLTWKTFLSYLGVGLALVGLTLTTFGTGTVAVAGAWALAGSAIASGASAAVDLVDKAQHGALDATTAIIDVAQIVSSIAQVGALKAGLSVKVAMEAAEAGAPLAGNAAEQALRSQTMYRIATVTRMSADGVTLALTTKQNIDAINEIETGGGTREEKDRAERMLLTMLAVNGGMYALTLKGELPELAGDRELILHYPVKGGPPVANVGGKELPSGLKFSQKDIKYLTGDGTMTIEELAASMKNEGWKGPAIDVVEMPDGSKISLDNRRLMAAQMAGIPEIPVAYHPPNEPFPVDRNPIDPKTGKASFELDKPIRRLEDGSLVVGGTKGEIVYPKGYRPANYGEAAMVRSANQGAKFGVAGSYEQPKIRYPKDPEPPK